MNKGLFSTLLAASLVSAVFVLPILNSQITVADVVENSDSVNKSSMVIADDKKEESSDSKDKPEETVQKDETVTFIVTLENPSLLDTVINLNGKYRDVSELLLSDDGKVYYDKIKKEQAVVKASIQKVIPEADFSECYTYTAVINGFSVKTPYSSIEKIKKISGVKDVVLANTKYTVNEEEENKTDTDDVIDFGNISKDIINASSAYDNGYTGKGVLIAVIDSEFDCSHEVFSVIPSEIKYSNTDIDMLYNTVGFNTDKSYKSSDIYVSDKIVFAYDYADNDNNTYCPENTHGTHVAAIAAGNSGKDNDTVFTGVAYDAQLALMKVFGDGQKNESEDAVWAAIDDAVKIGADIVSCSYGQKILTDSNDLINDVYRKLSDIGICLVASVGNESFNTSEKNITQLDTSYTNYGTVAYPSNLSNALSTGAINTVQTVNKCISVNDIQMEYSEIVFSDGSMISNDLLFDTVDDESEYIYIDSYGTESDYENINVEGKIIVVNIGTVELEDKINIAYSKDAKAVIVINSDNSEFNAVVEVKSLPSIIIKNSYKKYFSENPSGIINIKGIYQIADNETGIKMSEYSSYGVTADLRLKPDIIAPGTNIFSAVSDNSYDNMTGTSMSAPCVSGVVALLKQYINQDPVLSTMTVVEKENYISSLIMGTADVIKYSDDEISEDDGLYYSPRRQGAGLINIEKIFSANSYIISANNDKPKAELGDSETGEYSFTFAVNNTSDRDIVYNLTSAIQSDKAVKGENGNIYNTLKPVSISENADISIMVNEKEAKSVIVSAGSSVDITVTIKLNSEFIKSNMQNFPYGFYVDGYIFLTSDDDVSLNMPFMGFCGDWSASPIFDSTIYDGEKSVTNLDNYFTAVSTNNNQNDFYNIGYNYYTNEETVYGISIGKNSIKNFYDNSEIESSFLIPNFHLLRDVYDYTISISDIWGKTLFNTNLGYVSSYVYSGSEAFESLLSQNTDSLKNFFAQLDEGKYIYSISANTIGTDGNVDRNETVSYEFTVDNTSPKSSYSKTYAKDGKVYLELSATDNNAVQGFDLYTATYNQLKDSYDYADRIDELMKEGYISENSYSLEDVIKSEDGSVTFIYDITNLSTQLTRLTTVSANNTEVPSPIKIVYKAVDYAFNRSSAKTADTIAYGSVSFKITDQNGRGVSGVSVSFDNLVTISDADGKVVFENIKPDTYLANIISIPEDYEINDKVFVIKISNELLNVENEISAVYTGVVQEYSDESSLTEESGEISDDVSESSVSLETEKSETSEQKTTHNTNDNSMYALFFVGTLLVISIASLIVSRQRSKR